MTGFDLIPEDYRVQQRLRASAIRLAAALGAIVLLTGFTYLGLQAGIGSMNEQLQHLERQQEISVQQRNRLLQINQQGDELERQLELLSGLRSGTAATATFIAVDNAIVDGEVWFLNWEYLRAGTVLEDEPEARRSSYFIISKPGEETDEAWRIDTRMRINGQAKDHSALSQFVSRLYAQPEIADVRILSTSVAAQNDYVDFELKVIVEAHSGVTS